MLLTRQGVPVLKLGYEQIEDGVRKGAYIVKDCDGRPEIIFIATGSELSLAIDTAHMMSDKRIRIIRYRKNDKLKVIERYKNILENYKKS